MSTATKPLRCNSFTRLLETPSTRLLLSLVSGVITYNRFYKNGTDRDPLCSPPPLPAGRMLQCRSRVMSLSPVINALAPGAPWGGLRGWKRRRPRLSGYFQHCRAVGDYGYLVVYHRVSLLCHELIVTRHRHPPSGTGTRPLNWTICQNVAYIGLSVGVLPTLNYLSIGLSVRVLPILDYLSECCLYWTICPSVAYIGLSVRASRCLHWTICTNVAYITLDRLCERYIYLLVYLSQR